jgi:hypothetical protein
MRLFGERHRFSNGVSRCLTLPTLAQLRAGAWSRGPARGDATVQARIARGYWRAIARCGVAPTAYGDRHCSALRVRWLAT